MDFALFSLRQAARGRRSQLDVAGARLQRALLGTALDGVGESRVVVSGTTRAAGRAVGTAARAGGPTGDQYAVRAAVAALPGRYGRRATVA